MSTKTCTKCGVEKDVSEFCRNNRTKDRLHFWCKLCSKEHYEAKREEICAKRRGYYEANLGEIRTKKKERYHAKREELLAKGKERYYAKREQLLAKCKEHYKANRDELIAKWREYREANREKILAKRRTAEARAKRNKRMIEEPLLRVVENLRRRVRSALKSQDVKKTTNTMDLIGCSPEFLTKHLEKQIKPGTKREDYHVDHIVPCAFFNLTNEEEQKMCFHWTNLQLLLGPANQAKSDDVFWSGQVYRPDEVPPEIREEIYAYCRSKMTSRSS